MIRSHKNLSTKFLNRVNKKLFNIKLFFKNGFTNYSLLTKKCLLCDEPCTTSSVCTPCNQDLPKLGICCCQCALPIQTEHKIELNEKLRCGECINQSPSFTKTICLYSYEFPIPSLLKQIKYKRRRYWLKPLSTNLAVRILETLSQDTNQIPDVLIPIPLHPKKRRKRSYNQSELMAKILSKETGIPVITNLLLKVRETGTQTKLNKAERMKNLKNSLAIKHDEKTILSIKSKHIALIDDVMTTKSTAELASELLLKAGAKRVDIWCLARTPKRI